MTTPSRGRPSSSEPSHLESFENKSAGTDAEKIHALCTFLVYPSVSFVTKQVTRCLFCNSHQNSAIRCLTRNLR